MNSQDLQHIQKIRERYEPLKHYSQVPQDKANILFLLMAIDALTREVDAIKAERDELECKLTRCNP